MRGVTVVLFDQIQTGVDPFNVPVYEEHLIGVPNVLVAPLSDQEILESYNLLGRKAIYQLAIPKGDTHDWSTGKKVHFFGQDFRIIGEPTEGIEDLIPLGWNKKVKVEKYEQG